MDSTLPHHHGRQSFWQRAKSVAIDWVKITWFDFLTMVVLTAAALGIYQAPLAATRTFPITFDSSGDIVYPELAYPSRGWIIEPWLSALLSFGIPLIVILAMQTRIRSFSDVNNAVIGLCYSLILSTLFQVILKNLIGGFRPWFLEACQPDISLAKSHNTTGLNGVGYKNIMYTIEVCTQPDHKIIKTAATSFPSGHSTAAFAGFGYLFLYLNAKLKVWSDHRASLWKLAIIFAPIEGAVLSVCALTVDQAHNWYDCLAGSIIGIVFAFACYRLMYAAIWDWRFNHIPLHPKESCLYTTGSEMDKSRPLFTHQSGWGRAPQQRPPPSPPGKDG